MVGLDGQGMFVTEVKNMATIPEVATLHVNALSVQIQTDFASHINPTHGLIGSGIHHIILSMEELSGMSLLGLLRIT